MCVPPVRVCMRPCACVCPVCMCVRACVCVYACLLARQCKSWGGKIMVLYTILVRDFLVLFLFASQTCIMCCCTADPPGTRTQQQGDVAKDDVTEAAIWDAWVGLVTQTYCFYLYVCVLVTWLFQCETDIPLSTFDLFSCYRREVPPEESSRSVRKTRSVRTMNRTMMRPACRLRGHSVPGARGTL